MPPCRQPQDRGERHTLAVDRRSCKKDIDPGLDPFDISGSGYLKIILIYLVGKRSSGTSHQDKSFGPDRNGGSVDFLFGPVRALGASNAISTSELWRRKLRCTSDGRCSSRTKCHARALRHYQSKCLSICLSVISPASANERHRQPLWTAPCPGCTPWRYHRKVECSQRFSLPEKCPDIHTSGKCVRGTECFQNSPALVYRVLP